MSISGKHSDQRLRRGVRGFAAASDGVMAVEFAFIFPVVLVMLLGLIETAMAISNNLAVQAAARAGTHFGLIKPPLQGDMAPILNSVRSALPAEWVASGAADPAEYSASLVCECELTGAIACGNPCAAGEQSLTYLKVDVSKLYTPLVKLRYFSTTYKFQNSSQVRLK
jgi:TadE-like protein